MKKVTKKQAIKAMMMLIRYYTEGDKRKIKEMIKIKNMIWLKNAKKGVLELVKFLDFAFKAEGINMQEDKRSNKN